MSLIINTPWQKPDKHWIDENGRLVIKDERRSANYELFDARSNTKRIENLDLVNTIRGRIDEWREDNYPGVSVVTRNLLEHWHEQEARQNRFYFCQLEAIETLIWWIESASEYKQGIHIPSDDGPWERLCNKMATGTGKTVVMAMIITWQVLNSLTYPKRNKDFSKAIFIVAPGLTVKGRLQVLIPTKGSYYDEFNLCPSTTQREKLNHADILIENWHSLMPLKEVQQSVVKKGRESDEAFTRRVLGKLSRHRDIVVINDEAHHAYRKKPELKISKKRAQEQGLDLDEATRWIEGLDRIHKTRRIQRCFDLSATPFAPTGGKTTETALFDWIVSDFGLNDSIESGLVKTPRVVVRDNALPDTDTFKSKLFHIYRDDAVSDDLGRSGAKEHEPLPKLVQDAYTLLGADWREHKKKWEESGHYSPPVMLTVCNKVETAARIEYYFNKGDVQWPELKAANYTLRVDSKILNKAEKGESASSNKTYEKQLHDIVNAANIFEVKKKKLLELPKEELLRKIIDNVGKRSEAGQDLQNVISVAMLSEGWDAKNVTHIMGLRPFTSQLLCEQVVGRGLRRVSYETDDNDMFVAEYVNVFGVPLSIYENTEEGEAPPPPKPSIQISVETDRRELEIQWPNVVRIESLVESQLSVDWTSVEELILDPSTTSISADLAPVIVGSVENLSKKSTIDLKKILEEFRLQRLIFQTIRKLFPTLKQSYTGTESHLVGQLVPLIEQYLRSNKIRVSSVDENQPELRRIFLALNIDLIVQQLLSFITEQNIDTLTPVYDTEDPIGSTADMTTWHTTKPILETTKSHISHVVCDSSWEKMAAEVLEQIEEVHSYAKNDHLGFHINYLWRGSHRKYIPDFLIRYTNGKTLVLEIKGIDSPQNKAKRDALNEWVRAINGEKVFGVWHADVVFDPAKIEQVVRKHI